jgi:hypothetical protein
MEVKAALSEDAPVNERRAFLKKALLGAAAVMPASAATAADDQGVASSRMSYSRFLVSRPSLLPLSTVGDDTRHVFALPAISAKKKADKKKAKIHHRVSPL